VLSEDRKCADKPENWEVRKQNIGAVEINRMEPTFLRQVQNYTTFFEFVQELY